MSNEMKNIVGDEIKALTPKIYDDALKPTAKVVGEVAGRTAKALLAPVRGFLWGWEAIEKIITEAVETKLNNVPEVNRQSPDPTIAVPAIEALRYTAQNETLREMFLNLISNSMDNRQNKTVHPSFVDIIKRMNTLDALIFKKLSNISKQTKNRNQAIVSPKIQIGEDRMLSDIPQWYTGWTIAGYDEIETCAGLIRLNSWGLIDITTERYFTDKSVYQAFENTPYIQNLLTEYQGKFDDKKLKFNITQKGIFYINEFGKQFETSCI